MGSARRAAGLFLVLFLLTGLAATPAVAVDLYWDTNTSAVIGSGAATGTWGTDAYWNDDPAGLAGGPSGGVLTAVTTNADNLYIAAGTNGTTGTITVNGAQSANKVTFDDNVAITVSGGTSITLGGGGTGPGIYVTADVLNGTNNTISTPIVLADNITVQNLGKGGLTISGGVTGTGNITINNSGLLAGPSSGGNISLSTVAVNNAGTITNSGTSYLGVSISAPVGSNVTGITQSSNTSQLNVSGQITVNAGGTTLTTTGLQSLLVTGGGVTGTGDLILKDNGTSYNQGIEFQFTSAVINHVGKIINNGTGLGRTRFDSGANGLSQAIGANVTEIVQDSATSNLYIFSTNTAYVGTTRIKQGILAVGSATALGSTGPISFEGGTLQIINNTQDLSARFTTPGQAYKIDTTNQSVTFATGLTGAGGSLTKIGTGTLTLNAANTYAGTTTIGGGSGPLQSAVGGTIVVGSLGSLNGTTGTDLTFLGTGRLNVSEGFGIAQGMKVLTFGGGDGTVQSTSNGGTIGIAFTSLAARAAGATGNFVVTNGTNGVDNGISLAGVTTGAWMGKGYFFGGSTTTPGYAWYDPGTGGSYVRAINYASDPGAATSGATTSVASTTHQEVTGAVTAQDNATFTTLKIVNTAAANQDFALLNGKTVTTDNLLVSGGVSGSNVTIRGGTGLQPGSNAELVARVDGASDRLDINNLVRNGTNALTKSGAGSMVLSGANTLGGNGILGNVAINDGTLVVNSTTDQTYSGVISGGGRFAKTGPGTLTLNGTQPMTFTGALVLSNSTLVLDFSNMANPTNMINPTEVSGNQNLSITFGAGASAAVNAPYAGGNLILKGKPGAGVITTQSLPSYSNPPQQPPGPTNGRGLQFNTGTSRILVDPNGGEETRVLMGGFTPLQWWNSSSGRNFGSSVLVGKTAGHGSGNVVFMSDSGSHNFGWGGRVLWTEDGGTTVDFVTSVQGSTSSFNLVPIGTNGTSYTAMTDTLSDTSKFALINAASGNIVHAASNWGVQGLKIDNPASGQFLDVGGAAVFADYKYGIIYNGTNDFEIKNGDCSPATTGGDGMLTFNAYGTGTLIYSAKYSRANDSNLVKFGPGRVILAGLNTYGATGGRTFFTDGILQAGSVETAGVSGPFGKRTDNNSGNGWMIFAGGTLQYSAVNQYDYSGRFATTGYQPWKIDTNGQTVTYATILAGPASTLNKLGSGTLVLTAANTYTGGTSVSGGTLQLANADAIGVPAGTQGQPLHVGDGAKLLINDGLAKAVQAGQFTMYGGDSPTGKVDIQTGQLMLDGRVVSKDTLKAQIGSGYNPSDPENPWTGPGITSSAAAADAVKYAVGYAFNGDYGEIAFTTWFGRNATTDSLLVRFTYMGDADLSGEVTTDDFDNWKQGYVLQRNPTWLTGDFDYSGDITTDDFDLWKQTYVKHYAPLPSGAGGGGAVVTSAVPEPGTLVLLASGAAALALVLWRRRAK